MTFTYSILKGSSLLVFWMHSVSALEFLTHYLSNKTLPGGFLWFYRQIKAHLISFIHPNLLFLAGMLIYWPVCSQRDTIKAVRNNEEVVSHNHNHLIDSFNLFCCIAAAVPCWPILWKGGREKNILKKEWKKSASCFAGLIWFSRFSSPEIQYVTSHQWHLSLHFQIKAFFLLRRHNEWLLKILTLLYFTGDK